jgi:nucleoid-associated protein YgaU
MRPSILIPGSLKKGRGTLLFGIAGFLLGGLVCAGGLQAQDAAEAARQERARKAAEAKTPHHVYTEEDLKRAQILTPEDQAKVAARKNDPTQKKEEQAKGAGESAPGEESLGEVARRYRREKAEREAARATGQGDGSQFPMKLPEATMAAPKMLVQPKTEAPVDGSSRRRATGRVSPFEPRPLRAAPSVRVAPSKPGARVLRVKPEVVKPNAAMVTRTVKRGDSWWKLAKFYLGNGARWRELRGMNVADARPAELLLLGSTVRVPAEAVGRGTSVAKSVTVQKGGTLWRMAREHLGRGAAWRCLVEANPELGAPERLRIGQRVMMPAEGAGRACVAGVVKNTK